MHHLTTPSAAAAWLQARGVRALRTDHRLVRPGDAFLAWPGRRQDARLHASAALAAGAAACLVEAQGVDLPSQDERLASLADLKRLSGEVASAFLGHPSQRLDVVAVTGTNGKTSCTWWVAQALTACGRRCGVVGTLGIGDPFAPVAHGAVAPAPGAAFESTGLTTPDAVALQAAFGRFADEGLSACAIEASSIGIVEHRLAGTALSVAAFTNLTQDHLDYHGTMAAYGAAKRALFDMPGLKAAVIHTGDAQGRAWAAELALRPGLDLWTVSLDRAHLLGHSLFADNVRQGADGWELVLCERAPAGQAVVGHPVRTALVGAFNLENLLVVAGCLRALGVSLEETARALGTLTAVPGRLQRVPAAGAAEQPAVVVDYAHTPDALAKALQALQPLTHARGGQLWCVFGCGGDRDAAKRPLMGRVAVQGAAHVVVTSDNPRSEPPGRIVDQVLAGAREAAARTTAGAAPEAVRGAELGAAMGAAKEASKGAAVPPSLIAIEDRRAAIRHAVQAAAPTDVILLAGKGHEQTQEIAGVKHRFCDVAEAQAALALRSAQRQASTVIGETRS